MGAIVKYAYKEDYYPCYKCGACCRAVRCCIYEKGNGCPIYDRRPIVCRVIEGWEFQGFKDSLSLQAWIDLNKSACRELREKFPEKV